MAIVSKATLFKQSGSIGRDLVRTYKLTYLVKTDAPEDTAADIMLDATIGLPVQFVTPMPGDPRAVAVSLDSCERLENDPNSWHVSYTFDNASRQRDSSNDSDPTDLSPILDYGVETMTRHVTKGVDDAPHLNAAGDPFEPVEVEDYQNYLTAERCELTFNFTVAGLYNNAVNSDYFHGAAPGTLRVKIVPKQQFRNGVEYFRVRYEFKYKPQGWQRRDLNEGMRQLVDSDVEVDPPTDPPTYVKHKIPCFVTADDGQFTADPVTSPVPLSVEGRQLTVAEIKGDPTASPPVPSLVNYIECKTYEELPYSALGI